MDLIKILCGMLAVALILGVLTCGSHDNRAAVAEELESKSVSEPAPGVTGENLVAGENNTTEQAALKPAPPDSLILSKGESEIATERKDIEYKVRATVRLLDAQGEQLFPGFREPESPWNNYDFCIFVWTINGTQLVCPQDTGSEGKEMKGLLDADGKPIGELFIAAAQGETGEGWIDYNWKGSEDSKPARRLTFVKKASFEGKDYIVGSSFYVDDHIVCMNLSDCTYNEEPGNIHAAEMLNPENVSNDLDLNYSIAHVVVEPGEKIAAHMMKNPEVHYILEGEGIVYIDGIPVDLKPDQMIYIPAGAIQTTYNTGNTTLKFLAIDQPGWSEKNTEVFE
jgi:mannose-6-phosphate isomerase-like protein (cupin superfamily)